MKDPPSELYDHFDIDLLDVDREILGVLAGGSARTLRFIDSETSDSFGKSWIGKRLGVLAESGPVEKVDRGLYELQTDTHTHA